MIVMKFGGSSVESASAIEQAALIVKAHLEQRPTVVVSAMGKTTDGLVQAADHAGRGNSYLAWRQLGEIREFHFQETKRLLRSQAQHFLDQNLAPKFRELSQLLTELSEGGRQLTPAVKDEILSYGERISSEIVAAAFHRLGLSAAHLDARKIILTDNQFTRATPLYSETYAKLRRTIPYLQEGTVAVMGGFIGATEDGATTTLGRGGSDLTASIVGAGLCAEEIQIWTDVDGMLTCDPRILEGGHRLRVISYREAEEMARLGAKVLHPATMAPAMRQRIRITIRNTRRPGIEGTQIAARSNGAGVVKSIACKTGMTVVHLDVRHVGGLPSITEGLDNLFARNQIAVELVQARQGGVSFAVECSTRLPELLRNVDQSVQVRVEEDRAVIGLVGEGAGSTPSVMARALSALRGIDVRMNAQGSSLFTLCFVVPEGELRRSVENLHREFFSTVDPEILVSARERVEISPEAVRQYRPFAFPGGSRVVPTH
jgi:aspartate kinase